MAKKNYSLGEGFYYFNIKNGQQQITIKRKTKEDAVYAFNSYVDVGKTCEWLGKWEGKKFGETKTPTPNAAA